MSKIFEQLVKRRGLDEAFLHPKYEKLSDPFLLPDMEAAVLRIIQAGKQGEKVIIYGDYDADGVTAATVMEEALHYAGVAQVKIMLPDRFVDGYGMSKKVVQEAKRWGAKLVVTVDCGSNNAEVVSELKKIGVDTVVTDHHEILGKLPEAVAVVNPHREKPVDGNMDGILQRNGMIDLAGVGVAFMVARALTIRGVIPKGQEKWMLDLVLIGTLCDSMKMSQENRILCYFGLVVLKKTRRVGLSELVLAAKVRKLNSEAVGFRIGPRLNAAGRIRSATVALELLRCQDRVKAARLAREIEELNAERKKQQDEAIADIYKRGVSQDKVIVEVGEWHEGVLGIVAGRIAEDNDRPTFILTSLSEDGYKGSGRSVNGFNMVEGIENCRDCLISGGGHAGACGIKVKKEKIEEFRGKINEYYQGLGIKAKKEEKRVDVMISDLSEVNRELVAEIEGLEPFGPGNEEPIFEIHEGLILETRRMGAEGQHLSVTVRGEKGGVMKLVAFFAPEKWLAIEKGERANFFVRFVENEYMGLVNVEAVIEDIVI